MCLVKKNDGTRRGYSNASARGGVHQCGGRGSPLRGRLLEIQVSLSPTLGKNEKVEHHIRTKTHKPIVLRFWVESGVNTLCDCAQVSLVLCLYPMKPPL